jgi:hypothetical protein
VRNTCKIFARKSEGNRLLWKPRVDGRIIISRWFSRKKDMMVWTGLMSIMASGGPL